MNDANASAGSSDRSQADAPGAAQATIEQAQQWLAAHVTTACAML